MNYQMCTRCVMDTTDSEIVFNEDGVCNHCIEAEIKLEKNWFPGEVGKEKLEKVSKQIQEYGKDKEYDCIIGVSGGVDSSYLLHVATKLMNLRPLVVHVDAGWNSEIAVRNIENLVKALDLDLFTYVVDWEEIKDLQTAYLKSALANQDVPQDHAFFAKLYEFAVNNNIKYVLTGSNMTSESILPSSWGYDAMDAKQLQYIQNKFGTVKLKNYPVISYFEYKIYYPYIKKMIRYAPLNWIDYDKNKAIDFLIENYGWKYYGGKHHESRWTKFFQAYYLPDKFNYDKRKAHLSSLIVAKQITREEALKELEQPLYNENDLESDKIYISKKLGLSLTEFEAIINKPKKVYTDYPNVEGLDIFFKKLKNTLKLHTPNKV